MTTSFTPAVHTVTTPFKVRDDADANSYFQALLTAAMAYAEVTPDGGSTLAQLFSDQNGGTPNAYAALLLQAGAQFATIVQRETESDLTLYDSDGASGGQAQLSLGAGSFGFRQFTILDYDSGHSIWMRQSNVDDPNNVLGDFGVTGEQASILVRGGNGTHDILIHSETADAYIEFAEGAAPAAPGANTARLFCRDNGAGKTQLCAIFNTGAVQVIATQP